MGAGKNAAAAFLQRLLGRRGYEIVRPDVLERAAQLPDLRATHLRTVQALHDALVEWRFPDLPPRDGRAALLARTTYTDPQESIFLVALLHRALAAAGDVCEFGVAQGSTAALLAGELLERPERRLWLYDSFEGLPVPGPRDRVVSDDEGRGPRTELTGALAFPQDLVRRRLAEVGFPDDRVDIHAGFLSEATPPRVPDRVAFAYVDLDLYEGTTVVLRALADRVPVGGTIVVDDYGWITEGPREATDEFVAAHGDGWTFEAAPAWAGHFCWLTRRG